MTERIGSERSAVQNSGTEPTLQKCLDELETIESDLRALTDGLSETGLRWRPGSGAWSILHCLEHVNRTTEVYLPNIDRRHRTRPAAENNWRQVFKGYASRFLADQVARTAGETPFQSPEDVPASARSGSRRSWKLCPAAE